MVSVPDLSILQTVGKVAGIGGLGIGAVIILLREIIRKNVFPNLTRQQGYRLLVLVAGFAWLTGLAGIGAWVYVNSAHASSASKDTTITGSVRDVQNNALSGVQLAAPDAGAQDYSTSNGGFRLNVGNSASSPVLLVVSKNGFETWENRISVPSHDLVIELKLRTPPLIQKDANGHSGSGPSIISQSVSRNQ
jgi:hypothetical protein